MEGQESALKTEAAVQAGEKRQALSLEEAKKEVEKLIHGLSDSTAETDVTIHLWWEDHQEKAPSCVGVRISEISWVTQADASICGSSCFAGSPESLGLVAAAERCMIERMICTADDKNWDNEIKDADWRLQMLLGATVTLPADANGNLPGTAT